VVTTTVVPPATDMAEVIVVPDSGTILLEEFPLVEPAAAVVIDATAVSAPVTLEIADVVWDVDEAVSTAVTEFGAYVGCAVRLEEVLAPKRTGQESTISSARAHATPIPAVAIGLSGNSKSLPLVGLTI